MECTVRWTGVGMSFIAETGSNHILAMDGAPEGGGRNLAPRPMEVVLAGTGGCTAYDVVLILQRSRQEVTSCEARLSAERATEDPKVFTKIHMHFVVRGRNRVFAVGPEVSMALAWKRTVCGSVTARYQWETGGRVTTEGQAFNLLVNVLMRPLQLPPPASPAIVPAQRAGWRRP